MNESTLQLHKLLQGSSIDLQQVTNLIQADANPFELNEQYVSSIRYAIKNNLDESIINALIASPAPVTDDLGAAVVTALYFNKPDIALKLIEKIKSSVKACNGLNTWAYGVKNALIIACEKGYADVVRELLAVNVDITKKADGKTALMFAAEKGNIEIVKLLLDAGADPNELEAYKDNGNIYAIMIRAMLAAKIDFSRKVAGKTALMFVVERNYPESVRLLIEAGYDPFQLDENNINPVSLAIKHQHFDLIDILLSSSVPVSASLGASVLYALHHNKPDIALKFIKKMKSIPKAYKQLNTWYRIRDQKTLLILASEKGYTDVVRELLAAEVDLNEKAADKTALVFAAEMKHFDIVEMLLNAGADPVGLANTPLVLYDALQEKRKYLNQLMSSHEFVISHLLSLNEHSSKYFAYVLNDKQFVQPFLLRCFREYESNKREYESNKMDNQKRQQFTKLILNVLQKPQGEAFLSHFPVEIVKLLLNSFRSLDISTAETGDDIQKTLNRIGQNKRMKQALLAAFTQYTQDKCHGDTYQMKSNNPESCFLIILNAQRGLIKTKESTSLQEAQWIDKLAWAATLRKSPRQMSSTATINTAANTQAEVKQADHLNQFTSEELRQQIAYYHLLLEGELSQEEQAQIRVKKKVAVNRLIDISTKVDTQSIDEVYQNAFAHYETVSSRGNYTPTTIWSPTLFSDTSQSKAMLPADAHQTLVEEVKDENADMKTLQELLEALPVPPKGEPEAQRSESPRRLVPA